ncbi:succinate dehydrogenase, hydrophobic membrane anchor protein [Hydrocarboniphaga effusa]|jgi:succinate dehydrogenase / fumarate reductase membrane anchor subunit|uniref:succinate dehydrogenase, hydrophobic membrane anchor protein n=1 Tax=Hydrocarboniphaga effusa TaxID=243629 RepID=UPI0031377C33
MSLRSPLSRARGLGSAKSGVHHFWVQRLTAIALIPLTLWFVFSVANLAGGDYDAVRWWVSYPAVAVTLVLFIAVSFYHAALGVQVVIEDYVGHEGAKLAMIVLAKFGLAVLGAISIFAVLKVALS